MIYFKPQHENYCSCWLTADTRQQFFLYNKLIPSVNQIIEIISKRYFSLPFAREQELRKECVNEVFLKLKQYDPQKGKAFSFIGMVVKRYLLTHVTSKTQVTKIPIEYLDDLSQIDTGEDMYWQSNINKEGILDYLNSLRKRVKSEIQLEIQNGRSISLGKLHNELIIINLCEEYLCKFDDFSSTALADYCGNNSNFTRLNIGLYFLNLFGTNIRVEEIDEERLETKFEISQDILTEIKANKIIRNHENAKKYRESHKEVIAERQRKYRSLMPKVQRKRTGSIDPYQKRYREEHREEMKIYMKDYQEKNRLKLRELNHQRYLNKKKGNFVTF